MTDAEYIVLWEEFDEIIPTHLLTQLPAAEK